MKSRRSTLLLERLRLSFRSYRYRRLFSESMCDLVIYKMSDCAASVAGGKDIILLCDKVTKGEKQGCGAGAGAGTFRLEPELSEHFVRSRSRSRLKKLRLLSTYSLERSLAFSPYFWQMILRCASSRFGTTICTGRRLGSFCRPMFTNRWPSASRRRATPHWRYAGRHTPSLPPPPSLPRGQGGCV